MNSEAERIMSIVEQNGYRRTASRQTVVAALVESAGHITAESLAVMVRQLTPHAGFVV